MKSKPNSPADTKTPCFAMQPINSPFLKLLNNVKSKTTPESFKAGSPLKLPNFCSPFGSPRAGLSSFGLGALQKLATPHESPVSQMSKLFSEKVFKEALLWRDEVRERELAQCEPSPRPFISPKKRANPEVQPFNKKVNDFQGVKDLCPKSKRLRTRAPEPSPSEKSSEDSPNVTVKKESSEEEDQDKTESDHEKSPQDSLYEEDEDDESSYAEVDENDSDYGTPRAGGKVKCRHCRASFKTAQALGGHMSRKHPGKSDDYNHKKEVRAKREFERVKLLLAKKRYYKGLGHDYEELLKTIEGKRKIRNLLNRGKLKKVKWSITDDEVNDYMTEKLIQGQGSPSN